MSVIVASPVGLEKVCCTPFASGDVVVAVMSTGIGAPLVSNFDGPTAVMIPFTSTVATVGSAETQVTGFVTLTSVPVPSGPEKRCAVA